MGQVSPADDHHRWDTKTLYRVLSYRWSHWSTTIMQRRKSVPLVAVTEWPPPHLLLPDTIEEIEAGRQTPQRQRSLFDTDSREDRIERLTTHRSRKHD